VILVKSPCYITPVGLHYAPAMCYMVSRIGGSFKTHVSNSYLYAAISCYKKLRPS
jgi:hypothetical protein